MEPIRFLLAFPSNHMFLDSASEIRKKFNFAVFDCSFLTAIKTCGMVFRDEDTMMTFGQIKVYARRFVRGEPIPIFVDNKINRAINAHIKRIRQAKTAKRKS